jgi:hypothetical protein
MLKHAQNYCLRGCPRARLQKIDVSANKMVVFANRLYIDTYLFIINIEYLLQRLVLSHTSANNTHRPFSFFIANCYSRSLAQMTSEAPFVEKEI